MSNGSKALLFCLALGTAPQQEQSRDEKRIKDLEAARGALEKRLSEADTERTKLEVRLKDLAAKVGEVGAVAQQRLEAAEKKWAAGERDLAERLRASEAARAALEKRIAESETAAGKRLEGAEKRLSDAEADRPRVAARIGEAEAALGKRLADAEATAQKRSDAADRERAALSGRIDETDRKREALQQPIRDLQTNRVALDKRTRELEEAVIRLLARAQDAERSNRDDLARSGRLADELRRVKHALLFSRDQGPDRAFAHPFEEHFPFMGAVFGPLPPETAAPWGLAEGEGLLLREVLVRSPAHATDLNHGDLLLRANGVPIRLSTILVPANHWMRWEDRQPLPTFLTDRLPGESVELEYARGDEVRKVRVRLTCSSCVGRCVFHAPGP